MKWKLEVCSVLIFGVVTKWSKLILYNFLSTMENYLKIAKTTFLKCHWEEISIQYLRNFSAFILNK